MKPVCFASPAEWRGWIDGIRRSVDDRRYAIRFTPRRTGSVWSQVSATRVAELKKKKLMRPAGLRAFEARTTSAVYAYEQRRNASLGPAFDKLLKADAAALIACCAAGRTIGPLTPK